LLQILGIVASSAVLIVFAAAHVMGARWAQSNIPGVQRQTMSDGKVRDLAYFKTGDSSGPRVIFIHGTPGRAQDWASFLVAPMEGTEFLAVDRPGFGNTVPTDAAPSLGEQAAALLPFLRGGIDRPTILVGHSLGAPIACRAAIDYPELVRGIVLVAGALDPDQEKVYFIQHVGDFLFIPYLLPRVLRNANRELIPLKSELEEMRPQLERIRCPVVIVHGTEDTLVPFANVEYMRRQFQPDSLVGEHIQEGGNHFLPWNGIDAIRDAIDLTLAEAP
jgi:pimeloyl-ACP methyl ester carboxylesterase